MSELKLVLLKVESFELSPESYHVVIGGRNQDGSEESVRVDQDWFFESQIKPGDVLTYERPYFNLPWKLPDDVLGYDKDALDAHIRKLLREI